MREIPPNMAGFFYHILSTDPSSLSTTAPKDKELLMAHLIKVKADGGTSLQRLGDRIYLDLVPAKHFYTEHRPMHPSSETFHASEINELFDKGPLRGLQWSDQSLIQWYIVIVSSDLPEYFD